MRGSIRLGRVAGIDIALHYTWFIIAVLITLSLVGQFHLTNPDWSFRTVWILSVVTAVLFFVALLLHELAHSLVATAQGLPVRSITLFALGGVSQIEREAMTSGGEFWMAIAGPLTSAVIGAICLAIAAWLGWAPTGQSPGPTAAVLGWLGYINIGLAVFNMIPGFPLDGGRVLRSIVWKFTGSADRATRIAARIGQAVALLFICWGLFRFVTGASISSLWIAFIGWFLMDAALASYAQAEMLSELRDVHMRDIMVRECVHVPLTASLQEFVEQVIHSGQRCYLVSDGERVQGLITLKEVRQVPRDRWMVTPVGAIMRPLSRLHVVSPDTTASEGLEVMSREDVNQLPVVENGHVEGIVSRNQIVNLLQARRTLKAA